MHGKDANITISGVDESQDRLEMENSPTARLAMLSSSLTSYQSPKCTHGSSSKASACSDKSNYLTVPKESHCDMYTTPTGKQSQGFDSTSSKDERYMRVHGAPQKRDHENEMLTSARKQREFDASALKVREFRLSPNDSDGENSTQNSSEDGGRQQALEDMRG